MSLLCCKLHLLYYTDSSLLHVMFNNLQHDRPGHKTQIVVTMTRRPSVPHFTSKLLTQACRGTANTVASPVCQHSTARQSTGLSKCLQLAKPEVAGQEGRPHEQGLVVRTSTGWESHKEVPGSRAPCPASRHHLAHAWNAEQPPLLRTYC